MRCDDPDQRCPCNLGRTYALTVNRDASSGLARINWCPAYFGLPSLDSVIAFGKNNQPPSISQDLGQYNENKGEIQTDDATSIVWTNS